MATVLIVDDHAVVRGGLRQFLAGTDDLKITAEAATGAEAVDLVKSGEWSLVLLDIALPDLSGLEVLKRLRSRGASVPVLILTAADSIEQRVAWGEDTVATVTTQATSPLGSTAFAEPLEVGSS